MIPSRKFASASILAAATLFSLPACAADIDGTFEAQRLRINQGLASGALTAREGDTLRAELTRIAVLIARARVHGNGRISGYERRTIERAQANASRNIFVKKHDRERGYRHIDDSGMRRDR